MSGKLSKAESFAIQKVANHLKFLRTTLSGAVESHVVDGCSATLRTLLTDGHGNYGFAFKLLGVRPNARKPYLVAPRIESLIPKDRHDWTQIKFAQSAGINVRGMHLWSPVGFGEGAKIDTGEDDYLISSTTNTRNVVIASLSRGGSKDSDNWYLDQLGQRVSKGSIRPDGGRSSGLIDQSSVPLFPFSPYMRYSLSGFLSSTCMIYDGEAWSRKELIKHYSNKFGGVHLPWTDNSEEYRYLTQSGAGIEYSKSKSAVEFELLNIGQALANSEDAIEFCRMVQLRYGRPKVEPQDADL